MRATYGGAGWQLGPGGRALLSWAPPVLSGSLLGVAVVALVGVLAAVAPVALVALAVVLGTALAVWVFPLAALTAILAVRVAVPSFEAPNMILAAGGALGLVLIGATMPSKRAVLPLLTFLLLALFSMPWEATLEVRPEHRWLTLPVVDLPYFSRAWLSAREWSRLASVLVVLWLAFHVAAQGRSLRLVVGAVLVSGGLAVGLGALQWAAGDTITREGFTGISGPFSHPSQFAHYLVVLLGIGIVALLNMRPGPGHLAAAGVVAGAGAALYLTYSRTGWVAFVLVIVALGVFAYRRILLALALALPVVFLAAPTAVQTATARFSDLSPQSGSYNANSFSWRLGHWDRMLPYGWDDPITGTGFSTYHATTILEYGRIPQPRAPWEPAPADLIIGINAHNDYLKAFVEMGIPGVVLWSAVFIGWVAALWPVRRIDRLRPYAVAMISICAGLMLMSATDNVRDNTVVLVYAAGLTGAVLGAAQGTRGLPDRRI